MKTILLLLLQLTAVSLFAQSTYTVDSTHNTSGTLSIYAAVTAASSGDTISFDPIINGDTIKLNKGEILLSKSLVFKGNGINETIISGQNTNRAFQNTTGHTLTLLDLRVIEGYANGATYDERSGGAILNQGILVSNRVVFAGNEAVTVGGAIHTTATADFKNCVFSGNKSTFSGGGIFNADDATCSITNCTITGNMASSAGGIFTGFSSIFNLGNSVLAFNSVRGGGFGDIEDLNGINYIGSNHIYTSGFGVPSSGNSVDPLFIQNASTATATDGNFEPKANSPLVNQIADTTGLTLGFKDILCLDRVMSGNLDIGAFEVQREGANWEVTNGTDGQLGSLRYIFERYLENDSVTFSPTLNISDVNLTNGDFDINKNITIIGNGPSQTVLNALKNSRHFDVRTGKRLTLKGISLVNGKVSGNGGAIFNQNGTLRLEDVHIKSDSASDGGGIYCSGDLFANRVIIAGNWNEGIYKASGTLNVKNTQVTGQNGLGIYINNSNAPFIHSSTIADNSHGGIWNAAPSLILSNTICAGNLFSDIHLLHSGSIIDGGSNHVYNPAGGHSISSGNNVNPYFTSPQSTYPSLIGDYTLSPCSYGVDRGISNTTGFNLGSFDVVQNPRITGSRIDIGANEFTGTPPSNLYMVSNSLDEGCGSLRQIITGTDLIDTVRFDPSTNTTPIVLTSGEIEVKNPMKLKGNGEGQTIIDGGGVQSLLDLANGGSYYLGSLTLRNGSDNLAGGVYNRGDLLVENTTWFSNGAASSGAALNNGGNCNILYSSFLSNARNSTGAIYNSGTLTILNSQFKGNSTSFIGGAIYSEGDLTVKGSLFKGNKAIDGSGILVSGSSPTTTLVNNTIAKNEGRGVYIRGDVFMANNVIAKNGTATSFSDLQLFQATLTDGGGNYVTDTVNDHLFIFGNNVDPLFIDDNIIAPTLNGDFKLLPSSPLIEAGISDTTSLNLSQSDLGRKPRIYGPRIDIGAYEFQCPKASTELLTINLPVTTGPQDQRATEIIAESEINTTLTVGLKGYKSVTLLPGFRTDANGVFQASIEAGCFD